MTTASVTAIVTDPPYALEFMGKGWDKVLPSIDIWQEALRVLKPGGMLLCFGGTRTFHRLTCSIEDAGFQIRDCLMWLYGSGFPKSLDVSKAIDKAAGVERTEIIRHGVGYEAAPDANTYAHGLNAGFQQRELRAPATDAAKTWNGYGTALKPAWEPIVLAMKPTDGTFAANALAHGVAGINVDGCRVPGEPVPINKLEEWSGFGQKVKPSYKATVNTKGRWPANVIHDGIEEDWSRFFYCAKANKKDRGPDNKHPTVKPTELMRWLVRMVKMPVDTIILDPFMGSGSTGIACVEEGVDFIGIERDPDYLEIARRRLNEPPAPI